MWKVQPIKLSYSGSGHPSELYKLIDFSDVEQLTLDHQSYTLFLELYGTSFPRLSQISIGFTCPESGQDDLETQFYSYENFFEAPSAIPRNQTLQSVLFEVHTSYADDSRLSLCNILLSSQPERSELTIITFKGSNLVKFDIKLQNGTILPVDNLDCPDDLKPNLVRYSTQGIDEGRKCIEFVDKETQHVLRVEATGFREDNEEEEDYVEQTFDDCEDDNFLEDDYYEDDVSLPISSCALMKQLISQYS